MVISWNKSDKKEPNNPINKNNRNLNVETSANNENVNKQNRPSKIVTFKTIKRVLFSNNLNGSYKNINNNEEDNEKDYNSKKFNLWRCGFIRK